MKTRRSYLALLWLLLLPFAALYQSGCAKEFSFEGADTTLIFDSTAVDTLPTPEVAASSTCDLCHEYDSLATGAWSFKNDRAYYCGATDGAGFIGSRTTFTFFGPSACSADTGIVMTVYLPTDFTTDRYNVSATNVAFYYYDHKGTKDMFISLAPAVFSLTVSSYIAGTGLATGTFGGVVYTPNGDTTSITGGRFKVRLK